MLPSCLSSLPSHFSQGRTMGKKKTKKPKKNFTRKATPDSWGCWIFFFLFFFYLHPQPFFSLNTFHWGKGIWATWALALFLEARGANDHLYNWHDPVGTSQKLSHVICVPMDSCHSRGPPRMSWCPLIHLSHVSQRVLEQAFFVSLFLLIKHQKWYFSQWDLRSHYVCKRPRRHHFQELEIIPSKWTDTLMTCPQVKVTINTFTNYKYNKVCGLWK